VLFRSVLQLVRCLTPAASPGPEPRREEATGTKAIKIRFKTHGDKFSA